MSSEVRLEIRVRNGESMRQHQHVLLALLLVVAINCCSRLEAETVTIRVLNGKNGKPVTDEQVNVLFPVNHRAQLLLHTDKDGDVQFDGDRGEVFQILPDFYADCRSWQAGTPSPLYSVTEVLSEGRLTQNTCSKMNIEPRRGKLVYFVKPLHWWEAYKR